MFYYPNFSIGRIKLRLIGIIVVAVHVLVVSEERGSQNLKFMVSELVTKFIARLFSYTCLVNF